ncbi:MAG: TonB-dependent receptor plug domain-containing protein [Nitrospiria bacterium]
MKKRLSASFGIFLSIAFSTSGAANLHAASDSEEKAVVLPTVVMTATRLPSHIPETGSSITVIEGETIEKQGIKTISEALRAAVGIDIAQSGGLGQQTSVFLRGGESNHTLVLIDGVKVNSPTSGAFDFSDLLVNSIERVEVLRGPQSSLYGSEAIGGVINIITKRGKAEPTTSVLAEFGSFKTFRQQIGLSGSEDRFDYSLSIVRLESEGVSAASERLGNTEEDGYKNLTVSHRLGLDLPGDGQADFNLRYISAEEETDAFGGSGGDDPNRSIAREIAHTALLLKKPLAAWWTPSLQFSIADEKLEGEEPDNNFTFETNVQDLLFLNTFSPSPDNTFLIGLEYDRKEGKSTSGGFDERINIKSVFLEDQAALLDALFVTAAVRHDDHSTFGGKTTFRLTSAYALERHRMTLHVSYGTGFMAPPFNELFFQSPFFFGNKNLKPEESKGYDIGIRKEYPGNGGRSTSWFDVTYFKNDFDNLISGQGTTVVNIKEAEAEGVELSGGIGVAKGFAVNFSYTYLDSEDKSTGKKLLRRARHKGAFGLQYEPTDRLDLNLLGTVVEDRIDFGGVKMDDYVKIDFTTNYRAANRFEGFVRIENLFDENYEEVVGFTARGVSAYGGVKLSF